MAVVSMKQLLEAGVHFGHQTRRWNPKMAKFIFTERNGIYIIDLSKTVKKVEEAYSFLREVASQGEVILFVGTKKQAQEAIKEEAIRANMFFVNERWLGGMLTNFKTIETRIKRLKQLEAMAEDGTFEVLPKKEVIGLRKNLKNTLAVSKICLKCQVLFSLLILKKKKSLLQKLKNWVFQLLQQLTLTVTLMK